METSNARLHILDLIEQGQISAEEGLRRLQELQEGGAPGEIWTDDQTRQPEEAAFAANEPKFAPSEPAQTAAGFEAASAASGATRGGMNEAAPSIRKWKRWWTVPLWTGVAVTILGGLLMYQAMQTSGYGFWFFCASLPFILGLGLMVLAWKARNAPWLHLRIQQKRGHSPERINLSFPLPFRLTAWITDTLGRFIPDLPGRELSQMIQAANGNLTPENPIFIEVDEGDGEHVEIYIG
ncbi:MAG: hypothetical protein B6D39_10315 [Anaerolineae bacterium UTCFX2]|jgi:hypothetical protein|nr:hypothetical protein [Anaerolineae bacterium]OQY89101.1 MAG: hypothetical protein B6D39_10315 [Anaerolineae bacterium UTCFX2]